MAEPTPNGTATSSENSVIVQVLMMAGSIDWFSDVYVGANISGRRFGTPRTST